MLHSLYNFIVNCFGNLRIAIGTLTVAQHKQRISAASVKVSSASLPRGPSSSACTTHPTF